jgi:hypothetical protein
MSSTSRFARALALSVTCAALALAVSSALAAQPSVKLQSRGITRGDIAEQLGAKLGYNQNEEFALGTSVTAALVDPAKLAKLGIAGMHEGARVCAMRVAPDKLRIEVDELEPAPVMKKATLKIDDRGRVAVAAP